MEDLSSWKELLDFIENYKPSDIKYINQFINELSTGLLKLHELGINHFDIKPANIMYRIDEHDKICVKYIDYGASNITCENNSNIDMICTHFYIDKYTGISKRESRYSDYYSLGVVFFELLYISDKEDDNNLKIYIEPNVINDDIIETLSDKGIEYTNEVLSLNQFHTMNMESRFLKYKYNLFDKTPTKRFITPVR